MLRSWINFINRFDMLTLQKIALRTQEALQPSQRLPCKKLVLTAEDLAGEVALETCHLWLSTHLVTADVLVSLQNGIWAADSETMVAKVSGQEGIQLKIAGEQEWELVLPGSAPACDPVSLAKGHLERVLTLIFLGAAVAEQQAPSKIAQELADEVSIVLKQQQEQLTSLYIRLAALAQQWSKVAKVELIGDASDHATARLTGIAMSRFAGRTTTVSDSENWCHVNFFGQPIDEVSVLIFAQKNANNFDIIEKVVSVATRLGRPLAVVQEQQGQEGHLTRIIQSSCPNGKFDLHYLLQPVAGCILAELLAEQNAGWDCIP